MLEVRGPPRADDKKVRLHETVLKRQSFGCGLCTRLGELEVICVCLQSCFGGEDSRLTHVARTCGSGHPLLHNYSHCNCWQSTSPPVQASTVKVTSLRVREIEDGKASKVMLVPLPMPGARCPTATSDKLAASGSGTACLVVFGSCSPGLQDYPGRPLTLCRRSQFHKIRPPPRQTRLRSQKLPWMCLEANNGR